MSLFPVRWCLILCPSKIMARFPLHYCIWDQPKTQGSAQNSQQKEAKKGDSRHIHSMQSLLSVIHRSRGAVLPGISIFPQSWRLQHTRSRGRWVCHPALPCVPSGYNLWQRRGLQPSPWDTALLCLAWQRFRRKVGRCNPPVYGKSCI